MLLSVFPFPMFAGKCPQLKLCPAPPSGELTWWVCLQRPGRPVAGAVLQQEESRAAVGMLPLHLSFRATASPLLHYNYPSLGLTDEERERKAQQHWSSFCVPDTLHKLLFNSHNNPIKWVLFLTRKLMYRDGICNLGPSDDSQPQPWY